MFSRAHEYLFPTMADNMSDCRENMTLKKANKNVVS
ncbi:hypothetical protein YPPY54_1683, partial [Yersinia pestis PY-54]